MSGSVDAYIFIDECRARLGDEVIEWLRILRTDVGRMLPPHVEQRMRIEGLIKFRYRDVEAYLTRRGRRLARMLEERAVLTKHELVSETKNGDD